MFTHKEGLQPQILGIPTLKWKMCCPRVPSSGWRLCWDTETALALSVLTPAVSGDRGAGQLFLPIATPSYHPSVDLPAYIKSALGPHSQKSPNYCLQQLSAYVKSKPTPYLSPQETVMLLRGVCLSLQTTVWCLEFQVPLGWLEACFFGVVSS